MRLLTAHPQVYRVPGVAKELHFFDRYWQHADADSAVETYRHWFPRPPGSKSGEWTPVYMLLPWVAPMVFMSAPEAKLIVMLRDPVARYWSGLNVANSKGTDVSREFVVEAIARGRYASQLHWWERWFDPERILVLQFEACVAQPAGWLAHTYRYLGLDDSYVPETVDRVVNSGPRGAISEDPAFSQILAEYYEGDVLALREMKSSIDLNLWPYFQHLA